VLRTRRAAGGVPSEVAVTLPDARALEQALEAYPAVVERQGVTRLPELDRWYREELPERIAGRSPPSLTLDEMAGLTEWKMARGVWRQRNLVLVRSNAAEEVRETSAGALSHVPHPTKPISELAKLKGVGPATASAAVAAAAPQLYPFFDELVAAQLPGLGAVAWTLGYYARYAEALRAAAAELGPPWTPTLIERALWARSGGKASASGVAS
jgi:hypothetical protein